MFHANKPGVLEAGQLLGFSAGATRPPTEAIARPRTRAALGEWLSEATQRATSQAEPGRTARPHA